jgi:hypothetical protein
VLREAAILMEIGLKEALRHQAKEARPDLGRIR